PALRPGPERPAVGRRGPQPPGVPDSGGAGHVPGGGVGVGAGALGELGGLLAGGALAAGRGGGGGGGGGGAGAALGGGGLAGGPVGGVLRGLRGGRCGLLELPALLGATAYVAGVVLLVAFGPGVTKAFIYFQF